MITIGLERWKGDTWPCVFEHCSRVPVDLPDDFCTEASCCCYIPTTIKPGEPAIHILRRIIIATCVIVSVLFAALLCTFKKCIVPKLIIDQRYFILHSDSSSESENHETTPVIRSWDPCHQEISRYSQRYQKPLFWIQNWLLYKNLQSYCEHVEHD